jgi:hypothetical protein
MLMRSLVLRIEKLESQHKYSNNFIQKMFSQQQVMQAENITLDADNAVLKKDITQVNSEQISILAKLKELYHESIDAKRTVTEELQSSLPALQMNHDSLLSQICATEAAGYYNCDRTPQKAPEHNHYLFRVNLNGSLPFK